MIFFSQARCKLSAIVIGKKLLVSKLQLPAASQATTGKITRRMCFTFALLISAFHWYKNQFMFPDQLISIMVALTPASKDNGCLQVIKGSHKLGRVNHGFAGEQVGADMVMVNNALQTMELVTVN